MFSFYKHPTIRVGCGYCLFRGLSSTGGILWIVAVFVIFEGLLPHLFPFCVDLPVELTGIDSGGLCCLFLLEFLLVGAGLDMGAVNENRTGVKHLIVWRFTG